MLKPAIMGTPQRRIRWSHQEEMRARLHGTQDLRDHRKIIFNVLKDIRQKNDVRLSHQIQTVLRRVPLMELDTGKSAPCGCNRLRNRVDTATAVVPRESGSIASGTAADIDEELFLAGRTNRA